MTLEEAKNEVAKTHGCKYWGDLLQQVHVGKLKGDIETYSDEAAFLYAESKVENLAQPVLWDSFKNLLGWHLKNKKMKHYITFEKAELNSTITTLGFNLHNIAEQITYFQQYAKIQGVEHEFVINSAIEKINESLTTLKIEFNLPTEPNSCLELITEKKIEEVVKRANKDHDNPYRATIPKMKELIRSFNSIAEREGKETNWEGIKLQCAKML